VFLTLERQRLKPWIQFIPKFNVVANPATREYYNACEEEESWRSSRISIRRRRREEGGAKATRSSWWTTCKRECGECSSYSSTTKAYLSSCGDRYGAGPDVPFCYLLDKSNWTDFKRALNNCGYTWNLADWMHTVVHQGKQYQEIVSKRPEFTDFFQVPAFPQVEGKVLGPDAKQVFIDLLGFPKNMGEYIKPSLRFCNIERMEFEPEQKLPARQKLWSWIGKCLFGPKAQAGPFYYLTHQCTIYDISYLFKRLWDVMETVTCNGVTRQ